MRKKAQNAEKNNQKLALALLFIIRHIINCFIIIMHACVSHKEEQTKTKLKSEGTTKINF